MTRINVVPPGELHMKHLVAEYRELPRVFKLAEKAWDRQDVEAPDCYTLGKGHVKFFYSKLGFCRQRFDQLVAEMALRGFKPKHLTTPTVIVPDIWLSDWIPSPEALFINRERIQQRKPK